MVVWRHRDSGLRRSGLVIISRGAKMGGGSRMGSVASSVVLCLQISTHMYIYIIWMLYTNLNKDIIYNIHIMRPNHSRQTLEHPHTKSSLLGMHFIRHVFLDLRRAVSQKRSPGSVGALGTSTSTALEASGHWLECWKLPEAGWMC